MPSRRELLKWASALSFLLPPAARALSSRDAGVPLSLLTDAGTPAGLPSRQKLEKNLEDTVAALRKVSLANADAPDLIPQAFPHPLSAGRTR